VLIGAIGVSGDSSCADHVIAWKVRDCAEPRSRAGGVNSRRPRAGQHHLRHRTNMAAIDAASASGWGHPHCLPSDVAPSTLPTAP
jgi:hypothetical protein